MFFRLLLKSRDFDGNKGVFFLVLQSSFLTGLSFQNWNAGVSADFVQSPWDCLWESSGGNLSWKMRNCSIKSNFFFFFMRFYLLLNVDLGLNEGIHFCWMFSE